MIVVMYLFIFLRLHKLSSKENTLFNDFKNERFFLNKYFLNS